MQEKLSGKNDKNGIGNFEKLEEIVTLLCKVIESDSNGHMNLDQVEQKTTDIFQILRQKTSKRIFEQQDPKECNCAICGKRMQIKEKASRKIKGLADYEFSRRNFHCSPCERYEKPLDQLIGCEDGYTLPVKESVLLLGQRLPFEEASQYLDQLMGVAVNHETIQEKTEAIGHQIARDEQARTAEVVNVDGHIRDAAYRQNEPVIDGTAYLMMDGGMVQTREEGWKEVRNGILFRENDLAQTDKNHRQLLHKKYFSVFNANETALQAFKDRATQESSDFGLHRYKTSAIVGDGAAYIWDYASTIHPYAIQILDYYHASEYLAKAIQSLNIDDKSILNRTRKRMFLKLKAGHIDRIIHWLEKQTQTKEVETCIRYYSKNRQRMNYGSYRKQGLCIGSGAIESAHRTIVQTRMKLSGMHWGMDNVQSMVSLRAKVLSGEWSDIVTKYLKAA